MKIWFSAPDGIKAPNHDLQLMQNLIKFQTINSDVSAAALKKIKGHLWYLKEELAALAFFDSAVPINVKRKILVALRTRESTSKNQKHISLSDSECQGLPEIDISHFITQKSRRLF